MLTKGRLQLKLIFKVFMIQLLQIHYNLLFSMPQDGLRMYLFPHFSGVHSATYFGLLLRQLKGVRLRQIQINLGQ